MNEQNLHEVFDVKNLIAWLKTQDPNDTYDYNDYKDKCLLQIYGRKRWNIRDLFGITSSSMENLRLSHDMRILSVPDDMTINGPICSFGTVLKKAEKFVGENNHERSIQSGLGE